MVYNGREMFGKQRTVSTMSVIQIKGITMDKVHEVVSKHQAVEEKPKLKIRRRKQLSGGGH